ncbi:hypothetical protein CAPN004_10740 [Capnocytophaga cynodegmi]|uniref:hypothetical protein n=1 Tax=Capnocytophaga cynodegmi TaxID=28189 RepID=UPI001AD4529D|nr:hypothetical protein [Capnocytophaga cynodegmi]GIM52044.1 hypothetical protein CAPN004_10740 [Capnocytophaga cynodegmi]
MPIKQITPQNKIDRYLAEEVAKREKVFIDALTRIGEECVIEARENGDYLNQTGNLRSSIGYAIIKNGRIVSSSSFDAVNNAKEGKGQSKKLINDLLSEFSQGIALIVVAGMNYAAYVETKRNVISSSELLAKQRARTILEQLGFKRK